MIQSKQKVIFIISAVGFVLSCLMFCLGWFMADDNENTTTDDDEDLIRNV